MPRNFDCQMFFPFLYSKWNVEMRCSNASEKNTKCVNELSQATLEFVTAAVLRSCSPSCSLTQISALVDENYLASRPDEDEQPLPYSLSAILTAHACDLTENFGVLFRGHKRSDGKRDAECPFLEMCSSQPPPTCHPWFLLNVYQNTGNVKARYGRVFLHPTRSGFQVPSIQRNGEMAFK